MIIKIDKQLPEDTLIDVFNYAEDNKEKSIVCNDGVFWEEEVEIKDEI